MKKNIIAGIVLSAVLVTGLGAALAAPGTSGDPFITLSYLTDTYYAQAESAMLQQAQAATADTGKAAMDKLDKLASGYLAQAGGGDSTESLDYAHQFLRMTLSQGDKLTLSAGASLLWEAGRCAPVSSSGALVDVTAGSSVAANGQLTAGHRYVAAESTVCTVATDAAVLSVMGYYTLESAGTARTPFTDISSADWYYSYVCYAYENGLFQGVTVTEFGPGTKMNRAMLATVLYRLAGAKGTASSAGFTDVAAGDWYADAVNWAAGAGIVTGYEDGCFYPNSDVTREQMAVMLYRYAKDYAGRDVSASGSLSGFSDHTKVSAWAEAALSWAVGAGILTGYEDGSLGPGGTASRAEVATMLQRFTTFLNP